MLAWFLPQPSKEESENFLTALMHSMAPCARMTLTITIICSGIYIFIIGMWTISCLYYEACRLKEKGTACCRCFRRLKFGMPHLVRKPRPRPPKEKASNHCVAISTICIVKPQYMVTLLVTIVFCPHGFPRVANHTFLQLTHGNLCLSEMD